MTELREFHQANAPNVQTVKPGAMVLMHDDTPHINWCLAVVEDTMAGEDGLIRAAYIRTSTGRTNCPISKLYPLEVTAADPLLRQHSSSQDTNTLDGGDQTMQQEENTTERRPARKAALRCRQQVREWTQTLCGPLEDVEN